MSSVSEETYSFTKISLNNKVTAVDTTLKQCLLNFKELIAEVEHIHNECESYKMNFEIQKEKCESKSCSSSEVLKKVIESKETIIQLAAAAVTKFNETKNFNVINEILKILCGEVVTLTPPRDSQDRSSLDKKPNSLLNHPKTTPNVKKRLLLSPKKELNSQEDVAIKDESVSEIEGTPGRTSPIIHSKKLKSGSSVSSLSGSSDSRDKKKCPDSWSTPEAKQLKLTYTGKAGGKSRQTRLSFVNTKPASVVDLTSSPEFSRGVRSHSPHVQLIIKQESSENDDTILPSPTSGQANFVLSKTSSKESQKFKKPPLSLSRLKGEQPPDEASSPIIQLVEKKTKDTYKLADLEDSINILKPNRFPKSPYKASPKKLNKYQSPLKKEPLTILKTEFSMNTEMSSTQQGPSNVDNKHEDITHCEDASMSILRHVDPVLDQANNRQISPTKRPLIENKNYVNVPSTQFDNDSSMSLLRPEPSGKPGEDNAKRKAIENVEPVYKEPTVRKKSEKLALPGWCCEECKLFFGDLYADDVEKIKAVIDRCSKHRGRTNPVRPKTPPGIWNPRWNVPDDTEEFNRLNDAI